MIARLHRLEDLLLALALAMLVVFAVVQIGLRMLFDSGVLWLEPLMRALVLWLAMLGAMVAARESRHIGLELATHALGPAGQRVTRVIAFGFAAVVSALLAWHAGRMVLDEHAIGTLAFGAVPAWVVQAILPLALAVIAVRLAVAALRAPPPAGAAPGTTP